MNRALILAIVGIISLAWGIYDLRKKDAANSTVGRTQSWAQIIAGGVALFFSLLNWIQ